MLRDWSRVTSQKQVLVSLSDFANVEHSGCDLVRFGGTVTGQVGHRYLEAVSARSGSVVVFDEQDESDNYIKVGDDEWHLDWISQVGDL